MINNHVTEVVDIKEQNALMKKYEILVSEWNTLSIIVALTVGFSMTGLFLGILFESYIVITMGIAVMLAMSVFEYKSRDAYVESRHYLENELFKSAGMKGPKVKEVITKGTVRRR